MDSYIVKGIRTAVGKAPKGGFRFTRPDQMAVKIIKYLLEQLPDLDPKRVDDLIVGNAVPEAEQGLQMGRFIALQVLPMEVPGMIINRYCASGIEAIAIANAKIKAGEADCIIAGGAESMSLVPTIGWKTAPNYDIALNNPDYYLSMGLTAEEVAKDYKVTREQQDEYSYNSHMKALDAIKNDRFKSGILPVTINQVLVDEYGQKNEKEFTVDVDEGPRTDTTMEALAKLKPVFAKNGTVTAGSSSQRSDGAAFVVVMSDKLMKELNLEPEGRLVASASAGVDPRIMGIGPVSAVPKALKKAGMKLDEIDVIELNEAFASQSIAVINELGMDPEKVNVNGGAIALGHPLGCTGAKLTVQVLNELRLRKKKYGMVTLCVGGGQGIAGIIELLN
ncbi:MAG: acetyl-CoA C-acyltransferase [Bacteroidetes bacterium]|nr:acetyl-CoA C-acyltransferase [Bacteroidota bacterium]